MNDPAEQMTESFAREQVACIKEGAELLVEFDGAEVPDVDQFFEESMATNAPPPIPPDDFRASLQRPASLFAVQILKTTFLAWARMLFLCSAWTRR